MKESKTIKIIIALLLSLSNDESVSIDRKFQYEINNIAAALEYRNEAAVTEYVSYPTSITGHCSTFEICPKCGSALNRTYQEYCADCGQKLGWSSLKKLKIKHATSKTVSAKSYE